MPGVDGQQFGVGQTRTRISGGKAGDIERRVDSLAQGVWRKVGGTGVSLPLTQVDRHRKGLVTVVFDGFDLGTTDRHRLPEAVGDVDLACACSLFAGMSKDIPRQLLQRFETVTEA